MPDLAIHTIRRSRHAGAGREIVCRCGFVASGEEKKASAAFQAHLRIAMLRDRAPVAAKGAIHALARFVRKIGGRGAA